VRPSRIDSRLGLSPIENETNSFGFNQRTDHGSRASLSIDPAGLLGILDKERVEEPVDGGPEGIVKIPAHFFPLSLGEIDAGEKMDMGKRLAQLPVGQSSKNSHN
jgi:hypothetical protein